MNQHLQKINDFLQQAESLSVEEKAILAQAVKYTDAELTTKSEAVEEKNRALDIEAALEKVRSRSLAMHKSDELREVVKVVFERLQALDFALDGAAFIVTPGETGKTFNIWIGDDHAEYPSCFKTPWFNSPVITDIFDAIASGAELSLRTYSVAEKNSWFEYAFQHTDYKNLPDGLKSLILAQENLTQCFVLAKNSGVGIHFHNRRPLSNNEIDILKRFSKVFEQAYIRFLDLQRAEEQVRESQIETALERVRSRTMGMQHSYELREVIKVIFDQFIHLGLAINGAGFGMDYKEKDDWDIWASDTSYSFSSLWHVPYFDHPYWNGWNHAKRSGLDAWAATLAFDEKNSFFEQFSKYFPGTAEETAEAMKLIYSAPGWTVSNIFLKNVSLYIHRFATVPFSDADNAILKRFGKVFEQTYTRFKDLERAEAQAREAQIEAALERVRSRTMGMQKSVELTAVIQVVYEQLVHLGFQISNAGFSVDVKDTYDFNLWMADAYTEFPTRISIPYIDHPQMSCFKEAKAKGYDFLTQNLTLEEKNEWFKYCFTILNVPLAVQQLVFEAPGLATSAALLNNISVYLLNYSGIPYTEAENAVILRFAKVFEQTYTRFNDLKQAEEQAREAKIEAALEKIRSQSLAMHQSDELQSVINIVLEKFTELGVVFDGGAVIVIFNEGSKDTIHWIAVSGLSYSYCVRLPYIDHPIISNIFNAKENGEELLTRYYTFKEKNAFWKAALAHSDYKNLTDDIKKSILKSDSYGYSIALSKNSALLISSFSGRLFSDEENNLLKRFARVFEQAYTRFLDLQKAEAQTREAQIAAALERVRSRSLAMHKSDELQQVVTVVFKQINELGISVDGVSICTFIENSKDVVFWVAVNDELYSAPVYFPYFDHPVPADFWKAREKGIDYYAKAYTVEEKNRLWEYNFAHTGFKNLPEERKKMIMESPGYTFAAAGAKNSAIAVNNFAGKVFSAHDVELIKRFAKAFEQAYVRFLDLQRAEAQAREAKIEIALERVRTSAMSMHQSQDINAAVLVVFEELEKLDLEILRCGIGIIDRENQVGNIWTTVKLDGKSSVQVSGKEPMTIHPLMQGTYDAWLNQTDFLYDLEGDDLMKYYRAVSGTNFTLPKSHSLIDENNGTKQYYYTPTFKTGNLYAFRESPFPDDAKSIMKRFASVLNLTFSRFLDLQKSEIQAREAIKQASLDRVRGEIASMRTTKDLERIIPLVWNELTILGIPFIRCGVFIVDEQAEVIHSHLSTPDGKALAGFDLPFDAEGIGQNVLPAWRQKQIATVHWSAKEFADYTKNLVAQGAVKSRANYITKRPNTTLDLHFFPFSQGMLYAGNIAPLTDDEKSLVQSLADAFSSAYARYEDFNKLEAAKKQVERTLNDLKTAQTKLIQSEKMASLGELTAGIAHEIQNPLNFVNNFSEVNRELLQELKAESKKPKAERDEQLEMDLIDDLIGNEEKINHHGKRAGSIVKGMLQHSRTTSTDRQLTDINALADEFMRLSYHGLRAKNKTFNADTVTHFDPNLPQIEVVAQDIGRVLLNLFNNAFYAVNERSKTAGPDYKPEVTVETFFLPLQGVGGFRVRDNGIGIPDAIKDKIMQPFFTTKPTGEGTGLGLSLTYDIVVKGHGGSIQVNSVEREFTEFTIQIPNKKAV